MLDEFGDHLLAFANQEQIDKIRDRLGIEEDRRTTGDYQWKVTLPPLFAPKRNAGEVEYRGQVEVIGLERDRKGKQVEVAQLPPLLEGKPWFASLAQGRQLIAVGQKSTIDGDLRRLCEYSVNGLETKVRHRQRIGVGINQADCNFASGMALEQNALVRQPSQRATALIDYLGGHWTSVYRVAGGLLKATIGKNYWPQRGGITVRAALPANGSLRHCSATLDFQQ